MSGHLNGLQKKVLDKAPQALFVHCLAHRLNLVLLQSLTNISLCRIFYKTISGIPSFFHHSSKRTHNLGPLRIPTVGETRWSSNSKLLRVIINDWNTLKGTFQNIIDNHSSDSTTVQMAKGFISDFNDFNFTFIAHVSNQVFQTTDILFDVLQKRSLDINYCLTHIEKVKTIIKEKRCDTSFQIVFEKCLEKTELNYSGRQYRNMTKEEVVMKFRQLYFEILDNLIMQMEVRFQDLKKISFVSLADPEKFETFSSKFPNDKLQHLEEMFPKIFNNIPRLKNELELIYIDKDFHDKPLQDVILMLHKDKDIYVEAYKLFALIATIPSTSVSVERSFSCLKRLKTYLRNSMTQERLTSLANITIQKDILQDLMKGSLHSDIIELYATAKDDRI
ncbi:zinc finger MYM-type protein 1-like, partial [Diaphorina citri]|uniref:Zinc finger MYM-type protein 1-like n=1 Tax=Diaphorina citri TaxID=121845 RepID=A0A3Q0IQ68_DIACI